MSAEGSLPAPRDEPFGLIETFRWDPGGGYTFLPEHMERLEGSAATLGIAMRRAQVADRLETFARTLRGASRVRLVLVQAGTFTLEATALAPSSTGYKVALANARHLSDDLGLRHKTTRRDRYERPLAEAMAAWRVDEVLFTNERGELCEGARHNLFVDAGNGLLTPPLSCGLLPGTLRANLLRRGAAREAVIRLPDLAGAHWFLGNSVRGLVPAALIGT